MKKLVVLLLLTFLLITGCSSVEVTKVDDDIRTDSIKFSSEYKKVNKSNVYEYSTYDNIVDTIKDGTGIIYLGFTTCEICQEITPILNDVAKEKKIEKILYYDFKDMRDNNTLEYQELAKLLYEHIEEDDEGNKRITAPTVVFVNKGNIVSIYIGTLNSNFKEVMTEEEKNALKQNFEGFIDKMKNYQTTITVLQEAN